MSESLWAKYSRREYRFSVKTAAGGAFGTLLLLALVLVSAPACHQPMRRVKDANKLRTAGENDKGGKETKDKDSKDKEPKKDACDSKQVALNAVTKGDQTARKDLQIAELPPVFVSGALVHHIVVMSKGPGGEGEAGDKTLVASVFVNHDSCQTLATLEAPLVELASVKDVGCDLSRPLADGTTVPARVLVRTYDDKFPSPYEATYNHTMLEVYGVTPAQAPTPAPAPAPTPAPTPTPEPAPAPTPEPPQEGGEGDSSGIAEGIETSEATVSLILFKKDGATCQSFLGRVDRPFHSKRRK